MLLGPFPPHAFPVNADDAILLFIARWRQCINLYQQKRLAAQTRQLSHWIFRAQNLESCTKLANLSAKQTQALSGRFERPLYSSFFTTQTFKTTQISFLQPLLSKTTSNTSKNLDP